MNKNEFISFLNHILDIIENDEKLDIGNIKITPADPRETRLSLALISCPKCGHRNYNNLDYRCGDIYAKKFERDCKECFTEWTVTLE